MQVIEAYRGGCEIMEKMQGGLAGYGTMNDPAGGGEG
jgi:hypothetical protein